MDITVSYNYTKDFYSPGADAILGCLCKTTRKNCAQRSWEQCTSLLCTHKSRDKCIVASEPISARTLLLRAFPSTAHLRPPYCKIYFSYKFVFYSSYISFLLHIFVHVTLDLPATSWPGHP